MRASLWHVGQAALAFIAGCAAGVGAGAGAGTVAAQSAHPCVTSGDPTACQGTFDRFKKTQDSQDWKLILDACARNESVCRAAAAVLKDIGVPRYFLELAGPACAHASANQDRAECRKQFDRLEEASQLEITLRESDRPDDDAAILCVRGSHVACDKLKQRLAPAQKKADAAKAGTAVEEAPVDRTTETLTADLSDLLTNVAQPRDEWFGFSAYSGVRRLTCEVVLSTQGQVINWCSFASKDAVDAIAGHYEARSEGVMERGEHVSIRVYDGGQVRRVLSIHPAGSGYPGDDQPLLPGERSVLIASERKERGE